MKKIILLSIFLTSIFTHADLNSVLRTVFANADCDLNYLSSFQTDETGVGIISSIQMDSSNSAAHLKAEKCCSLYLDSLLKTNNKCQQILKPNQEKGCFFESKYTLSNILHIRYNAIVRCN